MGTKVSCTCFLSSSHKIFTLDNTKWAVVARGVWCGVTPHELIFPTQTLLIMQLEKSQLGHIYKCRTIHTYVPVISSRSREFQQYFRIFSKNVFYARSSIFARVHAFALCDINTKPYWHVSLAPVNLSHYFTF